MKLLTHLVQKTEKITKPHNPDTNINVSHQTAIKLSVEKPTTQSLQPNKKTSRLFAAGRAVCSPDTHSLRDQLAPAAGYLPLPRPQQPQRLCKPSSGHRQLGYPRSPPRARSIIPCSDITVAVLNSGAKMKDNICRVSSSRRLCLALLQLGNCLKKTSSLYQTFQTLTSPLVSPTRSTANLCSCTRGE